jgi:hypothetical protein
MKMRTSILMVIMAFLLAGLYSCEKEVIIDLPPYEPKIVIEGAIEEGQYPWVFVTKNAAYFAPVDSAIIFDMIVKDAIVVVSDGTLSDTLQLSFDPYVFPFLKYVGTQFRGEVGKTYSLKVISQGKEYTSMTKIHPAVPLDSLKFKLETGEDSLGLVWLYLVDPDTMGNFYRIFTKVLGKDSIFLHPYPSTTDDKFFNGQFAEYSLFRGRNPLEDDLYDDNGNDSTGVSRWLFKEGETVVVKFTSLDLAHFEFWFSIEQQMMTGGNPFSSPVSAKTNIQGGGLGVWGGYGVYLDTITCTLPAK